MTTKKHFSATLYTLAIAAVLATPALAAPQGKTTLPDFTKGEKSPPAQPTTGTSEPQTPKSGR